MKMAPKLKSILECRGKFEDNRIVFLCALPRKSRRAKALLTLWVSFGDPHVKRSVSQRESIQQCCHISRIGQLYGKLETRVRDNRAQLSLIGRF